MSIPTSHNNIKAVNQFDDGSDYQMDTNGNSDNSVALGQSMASHTHSPQVTTAITTAITLAVNDCSSCTNIVGTQLSAGANIAGTQLASNANIIGAQISAGANIAYSKLNLASTIKGSDITPTANIIGTQLSTGARIAGSQLSAGANIAGTQLADSAITNVKQGLGTWKVGGSDSWSGKTDTLSAFITGCNNAGNLGSPTQYFSVSANPPTNGQHVDFVDFLAISGQCELHCTSQVGLSNCLNWFFTYA